MKRSKLSRLLLSLPLSLLEIVAAQSPLTPINLPSIDFTSFGTVGLAGDFAGISLYQFTGQNPTSQQGTGDGVYIQLPNGALGLLGRATGTVSSLCALDSGLFVGGNFSSINGVNASNIAAWNFTSLEFEKLNDRDILGSVGALYCDRTGNQVYVGGDFQSGGSNNAIVWDASAGHWQDLPFGGFDGPINTIQQGDSGTILFGGTFDALGNGTLGGLNDRQVVNLVTANVTSQATTTTTGFTNPGVLFCTNGTDGPGSTWLLQDNTPGDMTVLGNFGYRPTRLRLRNTHVDGRGTKTFRFVAQPIDGIMNFTYTDPTTGQTLACDATCPLSNDTSIAFQDFEFVNVIGMNGFTLFISDWYGSGGGLSGIELFQDDIVAYADNAFNEPTCQVPTLGSTSFTSGGGNFLVTSSFPETSASYLSSSSGGNVTLEPHLLSTGNYSIRLFTPGCLADNTCNTRGIVSVSTVFSANDPPSEIQIYQTNNFDKYDTIFQGRVQAGSTSFRPRVVISGLSTTQTLVAQKVQFMTLSSDGTTSSSSVSSGSLNGLYEYAPSNWTSTTNLANVTLDASFDVAGTDLAFDANIVGIVDINGKRFVAGTFSSTTLGVQNIMQVQSSTPTALPFGGLNGPITSLAYFNSTIYLGGQFTGTQNISNIFGLNNVASFNTNTNVWTTLGSGLNGNVTSVVLYSMPTGTSTNETVVVVSGEFTQILGTPTVNVAGFAIWIPSVGDWAERVGGNAPFGYGVLNAETASSNGTVFVAGAIDAWQQNTAQGVIGLGNSGLNGIPLHFSSPPPASNVTTRRKRSLNSLDTSNSSDNVISAGAFYSGNKQNVTVIGGHFTLNGISNLAFINGSNNNAVTGLPNPSLPTTSSVYALLVTSNLLSIGGSFATTLNSNSISGLLFYDFSTTSYSTTQPPALTGPSPVIVNTLASVPNTAQIVVGGHFVSAGSLPCPGVCIYDTSKSQWLRPGNVDIVGEVAQIVFQDETTAIVVGNLTVGGNATNVAKYDFSAQGGWTSLNVGVTGPVEAVLSQDTDTLYLAGQNSSGMYFGKWTSSGGFQDLGGPLERTSQITALEFLPLSTDHASNPLVSSDRVILLMGDLQLPGFGNASAVLYDGSQYQPYILTTKSDGSNGLITTLFSQQTQSFSSNGNIALGWVIVIALAASLFLILLLVIGGIIAGRIRRKREGYVRAPGTPPIGEATLGRVPPGQLLSDLETRRAGGYL